MKTQNISLSGNEKLALIGSLSTMLTAGIPILETIDSLLEDSKGNSKKLLQTMHEDLVEGKHIYYTFAKFPKIFDKVIVNIIKASEEAGTLDVALKDLKENIRKDIEFTDKIRSALAYPILIFIVFMGVLLMILTFVVPRISQVFLRLSVDLPLPTKILMKVSSLILSYTIPSIILSILLVTGLIYIYKTKKKFLFSLISSLPIISNLITQIDLTRFSRSMYLLLNSGITITTALELTQDVVVKKEIYKIIAYSRETVLSGKNLSEGLRNKKNTIPSIIIKMTEAGEKTGSLDKSMQDISEYLDYQVSNTLKTVTALLEPIMLVLVGILVGGMMLAIIAPIYGMIGQVGAR